MLQNYKKRPNFAPAFTQNARTLPQAPTQDGPKATLKRSLQGKPSRTASSAPREALKNGLKCPKRSPKETKRSPREPRETQGNPRGLRGSQEKPKRTPREPRETQGNPRGLRGSQGNREGNQEEPVGASQVSSVTWTRSSMDRIKDSGSFDWGSTPHGFTLTVAK